MKTIQKAVEGIIEKAPFLEEAIYDKLINVSSLARKIQNEVEFVFFYRYAMARALKVARITTITAS